MNLRFKVLVALVVATATGLILVNWRGFPPRLGLLSAVAVGALSFHALGTFTRLRRMHHRPKTGAAIEDDSEEPSGSREA